VAGVGDAGEEIDVKERDGDHRKPMFPQPLNPVKGASGDHRIAIVGSRDYPAPETVRRYVRALPPGTTVVSGHGGAVDLAAEEESTARGLPTLIFPVCEERIAHYFAETMDRRIAFAKAAHERNRQIAAACTRLVAFSCRASTGTASTVRYARQRTEENPSGKPAHVFEHPATPLFVSTARVNYSGPHTLNVTRKSGAEGLVFAPSWALLHPFLVLRKDHPITDEEWATYRAGYLAEMRASYRAQRETWDALLRRGEVVIVCYCAQAERCHRTLLAREILPALGAMYEGERT
jgi:hypothetical protein